jgi:riboflavin synthase
VKKHSKGEMRAISQIFYYFVIRTEKSSMFTGIVKHLGEVTGIVPRDSSLIITVRSGISADLHVDQSVSHDGICLTVEEILEDSYSVIAVKETIERTNLRHWTVGTHVNLETSATPTSLLDGHIVQGHVDCCTEVLDIEEVGGSWYFKFFLPEKYSKLVVEKGSVAINGVSLTIAELNQNDFKVAIIPYTYEHTGFKNLEKGSLVNLEFDIIGKYVQRMMNSEKTGKSTFA